MTDPVLIATAGHVDHGKSTLVERLTGIDPDRWEAEKTRGITIDLGYAHLDHEGTTYSFVDVPGHEKFIHNMLAGIGSIDAVLFVIAADESIMPQTREHGLALRYLGVAQVHVVITKVDLVGADLLELLNLEIDEWLQENGWPNASRVLFSSKQPETRQAVLDLLATLAKKEPAGKRGFRLSVDRVFTSPGSGTVLTGTVDRGHLSVEERAFLEPLGLESRIRQLQQHGRTVARVGPHSRVAVNLGDVHYRDVARGHCLFTRHRPAPAARILVRLNDFEEEWMPKPKHLFHLHHLASRQHARLMWREGRIAAIELQRPYGFWALDRGLIRDGSPLRICAGFEGLDPASYRSKRKQVLPRLANLPDSGDLTAWQKWYLAGQEGMIELERVSSLCGEDLGPEVEAGLVALAPGRAVSLATWHGCRQVFQQVMTDCHREWPLHAWLPLNTPRAQLLRCRWQPALVDGLFARAAENGEIEAVGDRVRRTGQRPQWTPARIALLREFLALAKDESGIIDLRTLTDRSRFAAIEQVLVWEKYFINLAADLLIRYDALNRVTATLAANFSHALFSIQELKTEFDFSRKFAIPLLEFLDKNGWTRREGDGRRWIAVNSPLFGSDFVMPQ